MAYFPDLAFANYKGPVEDWFAWKPVKLWNDRWVWLVWVKRRYAVVHLYLDPHGGEAFPVYSRP